jgi:ABC-2 type transport system permease protein
MLSVIYILWLRQIKRYTRSRARIVGSLAQPMLFLLGLGFGFGPIYQKAGGGDYIQFLAPGVIAMGILFTAIFSGVEILMDRQFGFLKETLVAPISRLEIVAGRTLGGATVACCQGFIILAVCLVAGFRPAAGNMLPAAFMFMFLIALFVTAFGTAIASVMEDMQAFPLIVNFLVMPLFFLSGSLFPLEGLPPVILWIARLNPLTYGVDGLRGALTGASANALSFDALVLGALTVLATVIGARLFSKIQV